MSLLFSFEHFILGITIGKGIPLPEYNDTIYQDVSSTIGRYFPMASFDKYNSSAIKPSDVGDYLESAIAYLGAGNVLDPVVIGRAFLFYTISALFPPNTKSTIVVGWLSYIDDVSKVVDYDWGFAILAHIYFALDSYCQCEIRSLDYFWKFIEVYLSYFQFFALRPFVYFSNFFTLKSIFMIYAILF